MSLFDIYSANLSSGSPYSYQFDRPNVGLGGGGGGTTPGVTTPVRGLPERLDVNQVFTGAVGATGLDQTAADKTPGILNVAQTVGTAPGFVFERPIALAQNLLGIAPKAGDPTTRFGYGTILDPLSTAAGGIIGLPDRVKDAVVNSTMAQELKDNAGRPADQLVNRAFDLAGGIVNFFARGPYAGVPGVDSFGRPDVPTTVGQLLSDARARGFTAADIADLQAGRKSVYDFAERAISPDPTADIALRLATSPLNVLLGAGLISKAFQGVGLLSKFGIARGVLEYTVSPWGGGILRTSHALDVVSSGARLSAEWAGAGLADAWKTTTVRGLGQALTTIGKPLGTIATGYRRASIALTAAEVGGQFVVNTASDLLPDNGFLSGLRKAGQSLLDNRPLSNNMVFSLVSAFHFPLNDYLHTAKDAATQRVYNRVGSTIDTKLVDALGTSGTTAAEKLAEVHGIVGGAMGLAEFRNHILTRIVLDPLNGFLSKAVIEAYRAYGSFAEVVLAHTQLGKIVETAVQDAVARNRIRASQVVEVMKEWHGEQGGYLDKEMRFAYNGPRAARNWARYRSDAMAVSKQYHAAGQAVIGLSDVMTKEAFEGAISLLNAAAERNGGTLLADDVREILSLFPNIVAQEAKPFFANIGIENAPADISLRGAVTRLRNRMKYAPSNRELTHETAAWENTAPDPTIDPVGPLGRDGAIDNGWAPDVNASAVSGSRYSDNRLHKLGVQPTTVREAQSLRADPIIRNMQGDIGPNLNRAGFNVHHVSETVGTADGLLRPGYDVAMLPGASLPEQRIIAALLGSENKAGTMLLSVPAEALAIRGLTANGVHIVWKLDLHDAAAVERVNALLGGHFPEFTLRDTADIIEVKLREGDYPPDMEARLASVDAGLADIYGVDAIGKPPFTRSVTPSYIEKIGKGADANATYESILRAAHNDPRLIEYRRLQHDTAATRARAAAAAKSAGVPPQPVAGAGLGGEQAAPVGAVGDGAAGGVAARAPLPPEQLALPLDATGQMHAVHSVIEHAADPTVPALQTTLRAEADLAANGNNWGQTLWNVYRDTEVGREFPVPRFDVTMEGVDREFLDGLSALENHLRDTGAYTLKRAPGVSTFLQPATDTTIGGALRLRTGLGDMLDRAGPTSAMQRWWEALTAPRSNVTMIRAAKQSLMNQLIPHGASPKDVNRWLSDQEQRVRESKILPDKHQVRMVRSVSGLLPGTVNELAKAVFPAKVLASVGPENFWKLMDRSANTFIRDTMSKGYRGEQRGALGRLLEKTYTKQQDSAFGPATRVVGKTLYPLFRFFSDPRWWFMNVLEADILGVMRFGAEATRARGADLAGASRPSLLHGGIEGPLSDVGLAFVRERAGYISRGFDAERPRSTIELINKLPASDPLIRELTQRFGPSPKAWAEELDRMLYEFDTKGVQQSFEEEAARQLSVEERQTFAPLLTKMWQQNHETYRSIVSYFHGNNSRANWERIANSYWLYWPLSYQLKAGKWLYDVMTKGAFGYKTNLAGAAAYNQLVEAHKARLVSDPAYADIFQKHPVLWGFAQMLVPITPTDLGVSLNRPVRYAGGALGAWGAYKQASDPLTAAAAMFTMGPTYTIELLTRIARETFPK